MPTKSKSTKVGAVNTKPETPKPARVRPSRSKAAIAERAAAAAKPADSEVKITATLDPTPEFVEKLTKASVRAAIVEAVRTGDVVELQVGGETLTSEMIAAMDVNARLAAAKVENQAVRDWKSAAGMVGPNNVVPKPATPVLDWMNSTPKSVRMSGVKTSKSSAPRETLPTFVSAEHPETFTCTTCNEPKATNTFPTVKGPSVRYTRCRKCRDAAIAAKNGGAAA